MNNRALLQLISRRFGNYQVAGNETKVCCPFCVLRGRTPDTEYKLYINLGKGVAHCFRCDYAARTVDMFPQLAILESNFAKVEQDTKEAEALETLPANGYIIDESILTNDPARVYLESRGFEFSDYAGKVLYTPDYCKGKYSFGPRIILPVFQFNTYRGFQARTPFNHEIKYVNSTGMSKKTLLYNFDRAFSQSHELIITEGIFDCWKAGPTAVAAFGKAISDEQLRLVALGSFKRVYVLLDPDAKKEALEVAKQLASCFNTYICHLPQNDQEKVDPGKLSYSEIHTFLNTNSKRVY